MFSEALAEGAIKMGMPSALAHRIAAQTLLVSEGLPRGRLEKPVPSPVGREEAGLQSQAKVGETCSYPTSPLLSDHPQCLSSQGTAKLLQQEGQHPAQLRTDVLTPAGTTIYGLHALEQGGLRAATMSAVEAATCRAKELSRK